jgi:hypothetical protein
MNTKFIRYFLRSSGIILLLTGLAKLLSSMGKNGILETQDPILYMSFRHLFWLAGGIEIIIGTICLLNLQSSMQVSLVAWLTMITSKEDEPAEQPTCGVFQQTQSLRATVGENSLCERRCF